MFPNLHSDRLFGAFLSAISEIFPDTSYLEDIVKDFKNHNPPFLVSSAFPSINLDDKNNIRFFPKLILDKKSSKNFHPDILKDFKKVSYFEESIFIELIQGNLTEEEILENYDENYKRVHNLLMKKNHKVNIKIKNVIRPSNAINRLNNETKIFYSDGIRYGDNIELFFFVEFFNKDYETVIKSALKFLKDRGFGKDIYTGKGHFEYRIKDLSVNELLNNDDGDRFITLSRFIPDIDLDIDKFDDSVSYELDFKRSRDKSGEVRKQVRFFKEGSTFNRYSNNYGCIVESGKNYPAYEYGYAFPVNYTQGD